MDKQANRTLAICIALLPPIWAVAAPYIGVTTGAVSLICAGLCAANGDKRENALPISIGFLLGDLWAVLAVFVMDKLQWNPDLELFLTLCVMGGLAVLLSSCRIQVDLLSGMAVRVGNRPHHYGTARLAADRYPPVPDRRRYAGGRMVCWRFS